MYMYLFCVVIGAHVQQFQEAKGPETANQLRTAWTNINI
jgi:hypothetical protein